MNAISGRPMRAAVHVVDDDAQVRRAIWFMLETAGYAPRVFASGEDLLAELDHLPLAPMLTDVHMPGLDGFDVLARVRQRAPAVPVIMVTGHGDVACAVRAMKAGAVDFLLKPIDEDVLVGAVNSAAASLIHSTERDEAQRDAARRIAELSAREQDVLASLVAGKPNKVIAFDLGLSIRTVEMHRVRMMRRLAVRSLPEALRLAHLAGLTAEQSMPEGARRPAA